MNISLESPQIGQTQSSGTSSHAVPGAIPLSGSPISGSYTYPQGHTYFFMVFSPLLVVFKCQIKFGISFKYVRAYIEYAEHSCR